MTYLLRQLDEFGNFELIDSSFLALYPKFKQSELIEITDKQYQEFCRKDSRRAKFLNGKFVYEQIKVDMQAVIFTAKNEKLAEINSKAQEFINDLTDYNRTPPFERDTWAIQREEVIAWEKDNATPTPTLEWISQSRGVPLDVLRQKAYEKAVIYQKVSSFVTGQRQKYEDRLNAAETLEQVQAIEPVYHLPQLGE